MASVYANSTFNISADASNSGYSGLFRERAPDFASAFLVSRDNDDDHHFCYVDTYHRDVISSPLGRRAWVVQERFLSPRVIHFGNHQVHFECMQWATSEFRPDTFEADTLPVHTFKRLPGTFDHTSLTHTASQADLYRLWDELVLRYTDCDLTYASDMPVAIEGLARIFAELLGLRFEDYLHGLWRPRLAHELMWRLFAGKKRLYEYQRTSEVSAPSWSWLSIPEGSCSSRFDVIFRGNGKDSLTVLDINHVQPQSSSLRVRGKLCGATFERSGQAAFYVEYMDEEHQPAWIVTVGRTQFRQVESCSIHWDEQSFEIFEYLQGQQLYLLLGREYEEPQEVVEAARRNRSRDSFDWTDVSLQCKACRYDCLILAATEQDTYFRRVGYVSFGGPGGRQRWGDEERRAWFEQERPVLDRQFCLDDVPTHLYEDVDEDHEYTIWLV